MKCLVTGAAGFIGSHLCEMLLMDGHTVIGLDNLSTGRTSNISQIRGHSSFHFIVAELTALKDAIDEEVDWVFHLAAKADIVPSIKNPVEYFETNVDGTLTVLEWARRHGVKRFVYSASSSCYGIPDDFPTREIAESRPEYPYALTKKMGEDLVMHWGKVYGLDTVSLRLFNVYGPRHRTAGTYGAMFGVFMSQLANLFAVTIVGDGEQKRDFTYVTDVCSAFILAAKKDGIGGSIINIGSGWPTTVNRVATLLGAKEFVNIPKRPGEPGITYADISLARDVLGYKPKMSIEEGCKIMKELIPQYKDAPLWTPEKIKEATKEWFERLT